MRKTFLALLLVLCTASARAEVLRLQEGQIVRAPGGWITFCQGFPAECGDGPTTPRDIVLTPEVFADLKRINDWVNKAIRPKTDLDHWGVPDRWNYPDDGYGDCEDYALLKRRTLIERGCSREALLITKVFDGPVGHAVLTVKTDKGDFILDNQRHAIVPWHRTGYKFISRQSQSDPKVWVKLYDPRHPLFIGG